MTSVHTQDNLRDKPWTIRQGLSGVSIAPAEPIAPKRERDLSPDEADELSAALRVHAEIARKRQANAGQERT